VVSVEICVKAHTLALSDDGGKTLSFLDLLPVPAKPFPYGDFLYQERCNSKINSVEREREFSLWLRMKHLHKKLRRSPYFGYKSWQRI